MRLTGIAANIPFLDFQQLLPMLFQKDLLRKIDAAITKTARALERETQERARNSVQLFLEELSHQSLESAQLVSDIRSKKVVCIYSGWTRHSIGIVFGNDKVSLCNRGRGAREHAIMTYACPSHLVTQEFLSYLLSTIPRTQEEFTHRFFLPPVGAQIPSESIDMKFQKVGNCSEANRKAALLAGLDSVVESSIPEPVLRHQISYEIYNWSLDKIRP